MQNEIGNFNFYNPTNIVFGKKQIEQLGELIPAGKKVLITYGGGSVQRFGTLDRVKAALTNFEVGEFGGIEANPQYDTAIKAADLVKREGYDFLLAVGGGSVVDATKFIAAAAVFEGNPIDIFGAGLGKSIPVTQAVPFGAVLTLPATGSEMNETSVMSFKKQKAKVSFSSPVVFPLFSILEPELTYTLPERQLANGIIDSFIHICEQYLTYPVGAMVQDRFAESLLQTLIEIGPDVIMEDKHDYTLRANYMWTATLALNRLLSRGVPQDWATHALGHEITVLNNTDHARTLSIVLPALLKVRREEKREKLVQYAERVWHITSGSDDEKIDTAIEKTENFFAQLGAPVRLSEIGVKEVDINTLVAQLEKHGNTALSERKDQTLEVSREIYQTAL